MDCDLFVSWALSPSCKAFAIETRCVGRCDCLHLSSIDRRLFISSIEGQSSTNLFSSSAPSFRTLIRPSSLLCFDYLLRGKEGHPVRLLPMISFNSGCFVSHRFVLAGSKASSSSLSSASYGILDVLLSEN